MEDPVKEIRDVVRGVTEPYAASEIAKNIEKYYTTDAIIQHLVGELARGPNSRDQLVGLYKIFRMFTIDQKIWFHSVMFNEDLTSCAIDLTEDFYFRNIPIIRSRIFKGRLLVILDLKKFEDGKYRISRQFDIPISDVTLFGLVSQILPGVGEVSRLVRETTTAWAGKMGNLFLSLGWFGD
ncbi:uncharacterized protein MELLADRAFT_70466 [Melampsora larici-populina 98AG31]|uniref:SigF-like NTF2-like domain-containing protein n=1 Tax=Melampsora larici-populina (strain 98AG31 / pathotype 3-4-7) TaxID=747676 RepID=F4R436_MELLP|nr:uncharacterized protein MELLADRAFT_70466 [Melampsora larici-populina 98AG31]EGG12733.1 hypothetical protein MELLADRAFT_70466 [Melampsora larici-populina 98AG31]